MPFTQSPRGRSTRRHIICERDVGLFSLIQQVIANIPWAVAENRVPIAYFTRNTCYWTPEGFCGRDSVWEYYFEPLVPTHAVSTIPRTLRKIINNTHPNPDRMGYYASAHTFVTSHFGDHPRLVGKTIRIPYQWEDPDDAMRRRVAALIRNYVRPRSHIQLKANQFFESRLSGSEVIGVHIRGTDAVADPITGQHRQNSRRLESYARSVRALLKTRTDAKIFVATDDESSLDYVRERFRDRVIAFDSVRHRSGTHASVGPTGWIMPAYIAGDRAVAAQNGEDAVVEYLLLSRCDYLVHNGSSLARTVLLAVPHLAHTNTHRKKRRRKK